MHKRTFEATSDGAAHVDLRGHESTIEIAADPACKTAYVEVYTEANSGSSVEAIDALPDVRGNDLQVHLPEGVGGGGSVVVSDGDIFVGRNSVRVQGRGFSSFMSGVGGDSDMTVNGQRIQIRNGRTWVNGVEVTNQGGGSGGPAGDPPMPIHFRAVVPYGSSAKAKTYNGRIATDGVSVVNLQSYNGSVVAKGIAGESRIKTYNGDVTVGAAQGQRPEVRVETYNGDIRVLDDNLRLRPKTYNGDIRYPR